MPSIITQKLFHPFNKQKSFLITPKPGLSDIKDDVFRICMSKNLTWKIERDTTNNKLTPFALSVIINVECQSQSLPFCILWGD